MNQNKQIYVILVFQFQKVFVLVKSVHSMPSQVKCVRQIMDGQTKGII